jgi:hypothetical protein
METKGIMLCNGPLSGRQLMAESWIKEYRFFEQPLIPLLDDTPDNYPKPPKERVYYKSKYKFGDFEIFIWEGDML